MQFMPRYGITLFFALHGKGWSDIMLALKQKEEEESEQKRFSERIGVGGDGGELVGHCS